MCIYDSALLLVYYYMYMYAGSESAPSSPIVYDLHSNSTHVCVTCMFTSSTSTSCLVVVHQRISRLSSSGLMNIESSHKFSRTNDTAYGCIPTNLKEYQVGVIEVVDLPQEGKYHTYSVYLRSGTNWRLLLK